MRIRLFVFNSRGALTAKKWISIIWSSFLYLLHVDGVSVTTKRNWVTEMISLCFMMMLLDIIRPDRLTSEPSEHSTALTRNFCREFTVNDFVHIVQKLRQYWTSVSEKSLKVVRTSEASGYVATVHHKNTKNTFTLSGGKIEIEINPDVITSQEEIIEDNDFVAAKYG